MDKIKLLRVQYLPKELDQGVLYVSEEYSVAGHMCPCGCGNKIITPLGPDEWSFAEVKGRPTLEPSIGNWQLPCRSHYWIRRGVIEWSYQWTDEQITEGYAAEDRRRRIHYDELERKGRKQSLVSRALSWLFKR